MGRKKVTEIIEYEYFCDACSKPFSHREKVDSLILTFEDESYHNGDIYDSDVSLLLCPICRDKAKKDIKNMIDLNVIYKSYNRYGKSERVGQLYKTKWKKIEIDNFSISK